MAIPYYHVDAFTGELSAGNPAGVWNPSAFLADRVMQKIAAEYRHSGTALFIRKSPPCRRRFPGASHQPPHRARPTGGDDGVVCQYR